jgi:hypothetical protein
MFRRLFTLCLAVACACAPALAASAPAKHETADCCCAGQCPCAPTESTAPQAPATCTPPAAPAAVEDRAKARQPAARQMRAPLHRFLFSSAGSIAAPSALPAAAAPVALYRAHCSLLL